MRCLERNKRGFWYALYTGYVNTDGDVHNTHSEPVYMEACISAATGEMQAAMFGDKIDYDKVIVTDEMDSPIDEFTVLWIDTEPPVNEQTGLREAAGWDYTVRRVAKHLDSIGIAVKRVDVS